METKKLELRPDGWGDDEITRFVENVRANQHATFANKKAVGDLLRVDTVLRSLVSNSIDPSPMLPMQFMLRGHSVFLSAATAAMAGQHYESMVLQRAALECAAYGVFIGDSEARARLWLSRHDSKAAADNVREAFTVGKIKRDIASKDAELARVFKVLYDQSIDFGAHPNQRGILSSTKIVREGRIQNLNTIYLHEDGIQLDSALQSTVQQGLWNISAFAQVYPSIYEARGVDDEVRSLKARY